MQRLQEAQVNPALGPIIQALLQSELAETSNLQALPLQELASQQRR